MLRPDSIENIKLLEQLAIEKKTHNEQPNDEVTPLEVIEQSPMMSMSMSMQL